MNKNYDFKGYATKVNLKCSDGRTILKDAFKDCDGASVPLVWQHMHNSPSNILGHAILENRSDGVYAYCKFNSTEAGLNAKELVKHGDIKALSIYANSLVQKGKDVIHGIIREVSLVLTGANPGAMIDNVVMEHADGTVSTDEEEAIIYTGLEFEGFTHSESKDSTAVDNKTIITGDNTKDISDLVKSIVAETLKHAEAETKTKEPSSKTVKEVFNSMNDEQKGFVYMYLTQSMYGEDAVNDLVALGDEVEDDDDEDQTTVEDVFNSMTDEQKSCVYFLAESIDDMVKSANSDSEAAQSGIADDDGGNEMKRNVFDKSTDENELMHSEEEIKLIFEDAKRLGSMKEACLAHSITDIDVLFPDAKTVGAMPEVIKREDAWVPVIINNTKHVPFARVKSYAADITAEEARAKGYVKGNQKVEEVISVLKRVTNPTTIYKTQKLDRDDILDITDFDVVAFLKNEMRMMLNEELARAILTGDGRLISSVDKISEDCIRPVYKDVDPFVTRYTLDAGLPVMDLIDSIVRARKDYKGSGNPILFATTDIITDMLLVKDTTGRRIYPTEAELASGLRVSGIVEVETMEGISRQVSTDVLNLKAIMFNPRDYTIGSNAGGQVTFFDDFDIDYNKMKYLIETRVSGCLTRPKSAIVFEQVE